MTATQAIETCLSILGDDAKGCDCQKCQAIREIKKILEATKQIQKEWNEE